MSAENEITLGEVYRLVEKIDGKMVTKDEFYARNEGISRRVDGIEAAHAKTEAAAIADNAAMEAKIEAVAVASQTRHDEVTTRIDSTEKGARERNFRIWLAVAVALAAAVVSIVGPAVSASLGF